MSLGGNVAVNAEKFRSGGRDVSLNKELLSF